MKERQFYPHPPSPSPIKREGGLALKNPLILAWCGSDWQLSITLILKVPHSLWDTSPVRRRTEGALDLGWGFK